MMDAVVTPMHEIYARQRCTVLRREAITHRYASTKYSQTRKSIELRKAPNVNKGYLENALPLNDRGHESGV